jgi:hypothetical protein
MYLPLKQHQQLVLVKSYPFNQSVMVYQKDKIALSLVDGTDGLKIFDV